MTEFQINTFKFRIYFFRMEEINEMTRVRTAGNIYIGMNWKYETLLRKPIQFIDCKIKL